MTKVNKLKMIRKTTLIAMAVAAVFATMPTQAKNSVSPNMAFSWDGNKVLVNKTIEGADNQTIKMNQDGSVTIAIDGVSVKKDGELVAVFGNYYKGENGYVAPKGFTLKNSTFSNNQVGSGWFGPFFISSYGDIGSPKLVNRIEGTTFSNNKTVGFGGAIQTTVESAGNTVSVIEISNSRFENNHADQHGGAINLDYYDVTVFNTVFKGNSAGKTNTGSGGGAIASNAQGVSGISCPGRLLQVGNLARLPIFFMGFRLDLAFVGAEVEGPTRSVGGSSSDPTNAARAGLAHMRCRAACERPKIALL